MIRGDLLDAQRVSRYRTTRTQRVDDLQMKHEQEIALSPRDADVCQSEKTPEITSRKSILDYRLSKVDVPVVFLGIAHLIDGNAKYFWELLVCDHCFAFMT
jgi:hypothetical protein